MKKEQIFSKLDEVFRDIFDDDSLSVNAQTSADDIEDWDSLTHINLLAAIEDEFGLRFEMKDVVSLKNVGEMVELIEKMI